MCKSKLPLETSYQNFLQSSVNLRHTNPGILAVRSYKLPSAMRIMKKALDNPVSVQPTCFYFHCPYCSYLHNFKSSVNMYEYETTESGLETEKESEININKGYV